MNRPSFLLVSIALVFGLSAASSHAEDVASFPSKPIRLISPYPPGGLTDILCRLIAQKLSESWGQQVIVENKPGGASVIASDMVAKSAPDGYTLGMLLSTHAVNPSVIKELPYDSVRDFAPVTLVALVPGIMTVRPSLPARNVREVIANAKANPGKLTYASPGPLTSGHLSMELLKTMAGVDITHVPYKGGSPAVLDLLGGRVDMMISSGGSIGPHIKSGKLIPIATTGAVRVKSLPDVPTIAESGIAGYETYEWYGIFANGKTPREIVAKLQAEIAKIVRSPAVSDRIEELGATPVGNTSDQFAAFVKDEIVKWGKHAQEIGLRPE
jgi:tripartite-type tricarboxylate transporter receptor subunit TctC